LFHFIQSLVDPFTDKKLGQRIFFPKLPVIGWSDRRRTSARKIRCPVCIFQHVKFRSAPCCLRLFEDVPSLSCSLSEHIHRFHTDGGPLRACIACTAKSGLTRPSERGCLVHQLVHHFSYDQHSAIDLVKKITEDFIDYDAVD
jgi:hypothetical protein